MNARDSAISAGWTYAYSDALGMEYATRETPHGPEVMTADKTRYSPDEIAILASNGKEITPEIHLVKRIFEGTIVDYQPHEKAHEVEEKPPAPIQHVPQKDQLLLF